MRPPGSATEQLAVMSLGAPLWPVLLENLNQIPVQIRVPCWGALGEAAVGVPGRWAAFGRLRGERRCLLLSAPVSPRRKLRSWGFRPGTQGRPVGLRRPPRPARRCPCLLSFHTCCVRAQGPRSGESQHPGPGGGMSRAMAPAGQVYIEMGTGPEAGQGVGSAWGDWGAWKLGVG